MAGFRVHFDFCEADPVSPVGRQAAFEFAAHGDSGGRQGGAGLCPIEGFAVAADLAIGERDVLGLCAENRGDGIGDFGFGVHGRRLDGRGKRRRRGRPAGEDRVAEPCIADLLLDVGHFQPQFLGDDGVHVGSCSGTEILGSAGDGDGAVVADVNVDDARPPAAAAPDAAGAAEAVLDDAGPCAGLWIAPLPADFLGPAEELADVGVAVGEIFDAEFHRVHAELVGQLVHQRFHRKASRGMSGRTQRARSIFIGVDRAGDAENRGGLVNIGLGREASVAEAAQGVLLDVQGRQIAVAARAARNFCQLPDPLPAIKNSSRRGRAIFTGTPSCLESSQANCPSTPMPPLEPNPPPM